MYIAILNYLFGCMQCQHCVLTSYSNIHVYNITMLMVILSNCPILHCSLTMYTGIKHTTNASYMYNA